MSSSFTRDKTSPGVSPTYEEFLKTLKNNGNKLKKKKSSNSMALDLNSVRNSTEGAPNNNNNNSNNAENATNASTENKTRRETSKRTSANSLSNAAHFNSSSGHDNVTGYQAKKDSFSSALGSAHRMSDSQAVRQKDAAAGDVVIQQSTEGFKAAAGTDAADSTNDHNSNDNNNNTDINEADLLYYRTSYDCSALLGNPVFQEDANMRLKFFQHVGRLAKAEVNEMQQHSIEGNTNESDKMKSNYGSESGARSTSRGQSTYIKTSSTDPTNANNNNNNNNNNNTLNVASPLSEPLENSTNSNLKNEAQEGSGATTPSHPTSTVNTKPTAKYVDPKYYLVDPTPCVLSKAPIRASLKNSSNHPLNPSPNTVQGRRLLREQKEESVQQWIEILIKGSQDPWSRIRQECLKKLEEVLQLYFMVSRGDEGDGTDTTTTTTVSEEKIKGGAEEGEIETVNRAQEDSMSDEVTVRSSLTTVEGTTQHSNHPTHVVHVIPSQPSEAGTVTPLLSQTPRSLQGVQNNNNNNNASGVDDRGVGNVKKGGTTPRMVSQSGTILHPRQRKKQAVSTAKSGSKNNTTTKDGTAAKTTTSTKNNNNNSSTNVCRTPRTFNRSYGGTGNLTPPPVSLATPRDQLLSPRNNNTNTNTNNNNNNGYTATTNASGNYVVRSTSAPASRRASHIGNTPSAVRRTATPSTPHRSSLNNTLSSTTKNTTGLVSPNPLRRSLINAGDTTPLGEGILSRDTTRIEEEKADGNSPSRPQKEKKAGATPRSTHTGTKKKPAKSKASGTPRQTKKGSKKGKSSVRQSVEGESELRASRNSVTLNDTLNVNNSPNKVSGDKSPTSSGRRTVKNSSQSRSGNKTDALSLSSPATDGARRREALQSWVSKVIRWWTEAKENWFMKEGLLQVMDVMVPYLVADEKKEENSNNNSSPNHTKGKANEVEPVIAQTFHSLLLKIVFPALREAQLPVREAAVRLLERLLRLSTSLSGFVVDHVISTLSTFDMPNPKEVHLTPEEEKTAYAVQGYLQVISLLSRLHLIDPSSPSMISIIMIYAAYPASSVRQCVAEALRPPSFDLFIFLLLQLAEFPYSEPPQPWQAEETVLMTLQQHLKYYLALPEGSVAADKTPNTQTVSISSSIPVVSNIRYHRSRYYRNMNDLMRYVVLALIFASNPTNNPFEVSRMGGEVLPYVLQFWCRYAEDETALQEMFQSVETTIIEEEKDDADEEQEGELLQEERKLVNRVVIPSMWWFTAIRKERERCLVLKESTERGSFRMEMIQRILERPSLSPLLRGFILEEEEEEKKETSNSGKPCPTLPVVLNIIVAYFSEELRQLPATPRHDYVIQYFLQDVFWRTLLKRDQISHGLKFTLDSLPSFLHLLQDEHGELSTSLAVSVLESMVPPFLASLGTVQPHLQCILLADLATLLLSSPPAAVPKYRFLYQTKFAAPALLDGGEDLVLGYTWLRGLHEGAPHHTEWSHPPFEGRSPHQCGLGSSDQAVVGRIRRQLEEVLLGQLYTNGGVELNVIREVRSLAEKLLYEALMDSPPEDDKVRPFLCSFVAALLERLNKVTKNTWLEIVRKGDPTSLAASSATPAAATTTGNNQSSYDDWDDDDDDEAAVDGVNVTDEILSATQSLSSLLRHLGGDSGADTLRKVCKGTPTIPMDQLELLLTVSST